MEATAVKETPIEPGTLYVVATPIGNLGDISTRALAVLRAVDAILCEDTRVTGLLCQTLGVDRPKEAFHEHNTMKRLGGVIQRLHQGQTLALVSDRGMPAVSDPGQELVQACHREGIRVSVIPGASAVTTAFAGSGYPHPFVFWGFLPARGKERRQALDRVAEVPHTQILYEAPHRLALTLEDLAEQLGGEQEITIARELTKPYEEFFQGSLALGLAQVDQFRGELVLILPANGHHDERLATPSPTLWNALEILVDEHVQRGDEQKEAIRRVAAQFRVPRRELYDRMQRHRELTDG